MQQRKTPRSAASLPLGSRARPACETLLCQLNYAAWIISSRIRSSDGFYYGSAGVPGIVPRRGARQARASGQRADRCAGCFRRQRSGLRLRRARAPLGAELPSGDRTPAADTQCETIGNLGIGPRRTVTANRRLLAEVFQIPGRALDERDVD